MLGSRRPVRVALAACLLALTAPILATPAAAEPASPRVVLNDVHTDLLDVRYADGKLSLGTRVGNGPHQYFAAQDVLFQLRDNESSRIAVPDAPEYGFLGAAGSPVWVAPQVQDFSLLFAGWDTESLSAGMFAGDAVDLRLTGVDGPGALEVFQTDPFGLPLRVFSSRDTAYRTLHQAVASHVHANWAFTALGRYRLTFEATATDTAGRPLGSGPVTYDWYVGGTTGDDIPVETEPTQPPASPSASPSSPANTQAPTSPPTATSSRAPKVPAATMPCVPAGPVTSTSGVVLADGHVDYAVRLVEGKLVSQVKDGTVAGATTWRAPSSVVLHVVDKAGTTVPAGPQFAFLGKPGDRIWQIPQTQQPGVLWLGWNTESLSANEVSGDVTWRLDKVDGPGALAIFEFDPFGRPEPIFDSGNGVPDSYQVRLGTHAHGNWTFTKPGIYHVTFTHSAKLASGAQASDQQTVTFAVGPVDPKQALPTTTSTPPAGTCAGDVAATRRLASTGVSVATPISFGVLTVLAGAACLVLSRRRSTVDGDR